MESTNMIVSLSKFDVEYLIKMLLEENQSLVARNEMLVEELRKMRSRAELAERLMEGESA